MISGLLFPVLRSRGWLAFFRSRAVNVVSPYLVMTLLFTLYAHAENLQPVAAGGSISDFAAVFLGNLFTGRAFYHLWYIPILIVLYLATPLVAWLCDRPRWHWLVWLIMLVPLVASRTSINVSWSSVGYFLGAYGAGMFIGTRYEVALGLFRRHRGALLAVAGLSTLALLGLHLRGLEWLGFVSIRESLFYVQKLALAALVILWLGAIEDRLPQWLMTTGTYAFPIFLVHAFVLMLLARTQLSVGLGSTGAAGMLVVGASFIVASVWLAVLLSRLLRRVLGKHSRSVIGA